jgi:hypothetical protein
MKPDRSNYETWLIDWLDGTLPPRLADELMAFLDENPDIIEEADSLLPGRITPSHDSFSGKKKLLRSVSEMTASQAEYLSAAYLEGDLSPEQKNDLQQNIELNPENRIIFDKIQRTKLTSPIIHYKNKSSLKRISIAAKIVRISIVGLSAAAVIVFLILNHSLIPRPDAGNSVTAKIMTSGTIYVRQPIVVKHMNNAPTVTKLNKSITNSGVKVPSKVSLELAVLQPLPDSTALITRTQGPDVITFTGTPVVSMSLENISSSLIASINNFTEPIYDDERSNLSKFFARMFRDKILREKQVSEKPLKSYELAEAGIEGLNKLLGWQMALVKTNDEAGELKSLYFSSNLLKFNAPVRKTTEAQ